MSVFRDENRYLIVVGALLVSVFAIITWRSSALAKSAFSDFMTIVQFIGLYSVASLLFLWTVRHIRKQEASFGWWWIIGVGAAIRVLMMVSTPILEDDFYRYLLDGAMTASGFNPYTYSPASILAREGVPAAVGEIGKAGASVISQINHPTIRTIYPPVAQGVFAIAYFIAPFSIFGLRSVLSILDVVTFILITRLLGHVKLPRAFSLFYWWNPIIVKELINACHMDAILLPLLASALLFHLKKRWYTATVMIALATGVKLWPVVFVPLILLDVYRTEVSWRQRLHTIGGSVIIYIIMIGSMTYPVLLSSPDETSGFIKYTVHWRNNDALYRVLIIPTQAVMEWTQTRGLHAYHATRYVVAVLYLIFFLSVCRPSHPGGLARASRWLLVVSGLFLFSPTQFPWYFTWVIPLLAVRPWPAIELYMLTLPLYYFQHALPPGHGRWWFDHIIIWIEHLPVFIAVIVTSAQSPLRYLKRRDIQ